MATTIVPEVLTVGQARELKNQAIALGKLGDLNNKIIRALVGGHNPAYTTNYMVMWEVLMEGDAQASRIPFPVVAEMAVAA